MPTANEHLQSLTIAHATYLERYKRREVQEIVALLNDELEPAVVAALESRLERIAARGFDTGLHTTARLIALKEAIDAEIAAFTKTAQKMLRADLLRLAKSEAQWQVAALEKAVPSEVTLAARINYTMPAPETLRAIVNEGPINGALLKDWFKNVEDNAKRAVTKAVNVGLAQGETTAQIVARVRGTKALEFADGAMQGTRRDVQNIVGSSIAHTSNQAHRAAARSNADILKGEKYSATLDTKTCRVCAGLDGKVFGIDEGPEPPMHPGPCRCYRLPVMKSWEELGIKGPKLPVGTRASMDGQVPADLTFGDWLKQQPVGRVQDVLGSKEAARAFLAGEVSITDFSTKMGRPLSWKQVVKMGV